MDAGRPQEAKMGMVLFKKLAGHSLSIIPDRLLKRETT